MQESRRNLILLLILIVFGVLIFLIYLWFSALSAPSERGLPKSSNLPQKTPEFLGRISAKTPLSGKFNTFKEAPSLALEPVSFEAFKTFLEPLQNNFPDPFLFSSPEIQQPRASIEVTKEEIFQFGYPEDYIKILKELNQQMIASDFLKEDEIYSIASMEEAIIFQDKFVEYLKFLSQNSENGGFSENEISVYQKSYREVLPRLWREELKAKKNSETSSSQILKSIFENRRVFIQKKRILTLKFLKENFISFFVQVAQAQFSANGLCYRGGAPNFIRGSQRAAPCCNCGFLCTSKGCSFIQNCGSSGGSCNVQLGCLNKACPFLPAIWDPATGICGCYI